MIYHDSEKTLKYLYFCKVKGSVICCHSNNYSSLEAFSLAPWKSCGQVYLFIVSLMEMLKKIGTLPGCQQHCISSQSSFFLGQKDYWDPIYTQMGSILRSSCFQTVFLCPCVSSTLCWWIYKVAVAWLLPQAVNMMQMNTQCFPSGNWDQRKKLCPSLMRRDMLLSERI